VAYVVNIKDRVPFDRLKTGFGSSGCKKALGKSAI